MANRSIGIGVVIAALVLGIMIGGPITGTLAYFQSSQVTGPHDLNTWQCILWEQTTQAEFETDIGVNVSTSVQPDSVILANQTIILDSQTITFPSVYGMSGNAGTAFSMYNLSNSTWVSLATTPYNVGAGGSLAYGRDGNIYATRGGNRDDFWRYNISDNIWAAMTDVPQNVVAGGSLAYGGSGSIYLLTGTARFYRYDISSNAWTRLEDNPVNVNDGASLAWTEDGNLYAMTDNGGRRFYRYNISGDTWTRLPPANTPGIPDTGGSLAYTRNGKLFAFRGADTYHFWNYTLSTDTWANMSSSLTPLDVSTGGALVYTDNGNLSAFRGHTTRFFWQYNLSSQTWINLSTVVPTAVGAGGSLAYVPRNVSVPIYTSVYVPYGNLTSVVNNSGKSGTTWNSLIWNGATTPGVTNITFQVRANDTSFLPTDASPSWVDAGWPSPVSTGLPSGQYFQWQAILTTSDLNTTPRLDDVSLCYAY